MKLNHNFNNTEFYGHENFHIYGGIWVLQFGLFAAAIDCLCRYMYTPPRVYTEKSILLSIKVSKCVV